MTGRSQLREQRGKMSVANDSREGGDTKDKREDKRLRLFPLSPHGADPQRQPSVKGDR